MDNDRVPSGEPTVARSAADASYSRQFQALLAALPDEARPLLFDLDSTVGDRLGEAERRGEESWLHDRSDLEAAAAEAAEVRGLATRAAAGAGSW